MTKIPNTVAPSDQLRIGAAYIRVSTDDQLEYSPESQLEEIRSYCVKNRILLSKEYIFVEEEGRSGRHSQNRTAFQRMIATAKRSPKPFDVIVLWKFSRFARNQDESTFYKSMLRKKLGIDVVSVSEPLMEGMYGRLIEMIIEWQDEFYSVNLSAEVKRSMRYKAEKGLYNGKVPLGYHKEPNAFPVIIDTEAYIVRTIFQLFTTGYDKNYIVRYLNKHGYKTKTGKNFNSDAVSYILENPFYIGKIRWNRRESSHSNTLKSRSEWIITESHHEPIIDADTWQAAQNRIRKLVETHAKYAHPVSHTKHWLSGMVKCSICGKSLSYKPGYGSNNAGFQCLGYRQGLHPESQFISDRKLTAAVISSLHEVADLESDASFRLVRMSRQDDDLERQLLENELEGLKRKERLIKEAYMNEVDSLDEYRHNKALIERRHEELVSMLDNLKNSSLPPADYKEHFLSKVKTVLDVIESDAPYELKGESLRSIVEKIVFYKTTKTLEFHYYLSV